MKEKTAKKIMKGLVETYDAISSEFDQTRKSDWKEFKQFLKYIKKDSTLADIGCGNGRFLEFLKTSKLNTKYTGIDRSKELLKKARKQNPNANFIEGDLLDLPLPNGKTDMAVLIASLHHIPSKKLRTKAIHELQRILKKDGIAIVTTWNLFQPKYKKYIWHSRIRSILSLGKYDLRDTFIPWGKEKKQRYYYAFTQKELRNLLKKDFQIIEESKGNNIVMICKKK